MKTKVLDFSTLVEAGRWDIDFHLPPQEIKKFEGGKVVKISELADVRKLKRDPTSKPEELFLYIDIASVDVSTGSISNPQELTGDEAPSRARKVVAAHDIIVSTCRPTRGAVAVVPIELHNQIASTAFTVLAPKSGVNPYFLHFVLRLESTKEQFRKWSTGSSYPAILDEDVQKTRVPLVSTEEQDLIAERVISALAEREAAIAKANADWNKTVDGISDEISANRVSGDTGKIAYSSSEIAKRQEKLPKLTFDVAKRKAKKKS